MSTSFLLTTAITSAAALFVSALAYGLKHYKSKEGNPATTWMFFDDEIQKEIYR